MEKFNNEETKYLVFHKTKYLSDVLDYYDSELKEQDVFKYIVNLYEQEKIAEIVKTKLLQALARYKMFIIDKLANCKELHIKLVNNQSKYYNVSRSQFYKDVPKE